MNKAAKIGMKKPKKMSKSAWRCGSVRASIEGKSKKKRRKK